MRRRQVIRIATLVVWSLALIGVGFAIRTYTYYAPTICIVVHSNGAPAPANCADPNSYQVNN
jgi:hypothetical protein